MSADSPRLAEITAALVDALAVQHRSLDLTGLRIHVGSYHAPPLLPFASVSAPELLADPGRARRGLWEHTARYRVRCWTAATGDGLLDDRIDRATAIVEELVAAVEDAHGDRTSFLYCVDSVRVAAQIDPVSDLMASSAPTAELIIDIRYRRVSGQGT